MKLGLLLAVEAKTRLSSEIERPQVLLLEEPRNSRAEPSASCGRGPGQKPHIFLYGAAEAAVAAGAVDPAVKAIAEIARAGVGVAGAQPVKRIFFSSAISSPFVSFRKRVCGAWVTRRPPLAKQRLVGMER